MREFFGTMLLTFILLYVGALKGLVGRIATRRATPGRADGGAGRLLSALAACLLAGAMSFTALREAEAPVGAGLVFVTVSMSLLGAVVGYLVFLRVYTGRWWRPRMLARRPTDARLQPPGDKS